jgi:hypothetical protein
MVCDGRIRRSQTELDAAPHRLNDRAVCCVAKRWPRVFGSRLGEVGRRLRDGGDGSDADVLRLD